MLYHQAIPAVLTIIPPPLLYFHALSNFPMFLFFSSILILLQYQINSPFKFSSKKNKFITIMTTFITQSLASDHFSSTYTVPRQYIDCRQLLNIKLYGPTGNQKPQLKIEQKLKFKKKFYLDQSIEPFKGNPSPNKYVEKYSTQKRYKSQSVFITKLKQNEVNLGKRSTWIQDIENYEQKYNPPSSVNYKILGNSDFSVPKRSLSLQNLLRNRIKYNNLDDKIFVAAQVPGPGSHNPRTPVKKLKVNMMTCKMWKNKHKQDSKRMENKLNQSKTSSFSYSPMKDKTFDSLSKLPKKDSTLMKINDIDKRKGIKSKIKSPGPGAHNIINKWATTTFKKQNINGNLNLFAKTTRSLPSLKVYQ